MNPIVRAFALCAVLVLCVTALSACKKEDGVSAVSEVSTALSPTPTGAEGQTDSDRAFALYTAAMKQYNAAKSHDATLTGTATVTTGDTATEWTLDVAWISEQPTKDPAKFKDHLTETIVKNNEVTERDVYYGNGVLYASQGGRKFRQLTDRKTAIGETALFTLPTMTKAAFSTPLLVNEKGNTVVSLPMNGDILSEQLLKKDGALAYLLGGIDDAAAYTFRNVTATFSVDENGALCGFGVYCTVTNDAASLTATVSLSIVYNRIGRALSVKLPDPSKYKERIGSGLSKEAYAAMTDVVDLLFGADGNRVADFDTAYATACKAYKKALVDEILEWFEEQ